MVMVPFENPHGHAFTFSGPQGPSIDALQPRSRYPNANLIGKAQNGIRGPAGFPAASRKGTLDTFMLALRGFLWLQEKANQFLTYLGDLEGGPKKDMSHPAFPKVT